VNNWHKKLHRELTGAMFSLVQTYFNVMLRSFPKKHFVLQFSLGEMKSEIWGNVKKNLRTL